MPFAGFISLLAALARVALGPWSKPPSLRRLLFQSAVKSAESSSTHQLSAGGRWVLIKYQHVKHLQLNSDAVEKNKYIVVIIIS